MWLVVLLLFFAAVWWLLNRARAPDSYTQVRPEEVKLESMPEEKARDLEDEMNENPLNIAIQDVQFSVRSDNGELVMNVYASEAEKDGSNYSLSEGVIQFQTEQGRELVLTVTDGLYEQDQGVVRIRGDIIGAINESRQFFSADELTWTQSSNDLTATKVLYQAPSIEVSGESMLIDMDSGEVRFDGTVEANI